MDKIIFTCKTITPLVMNGAFGKIPELRPPGIKASLRFWWRALHGHLTLDDLRKREGEIFGNTQGRSKILIRMSEIKDNSVDKSTSLLPHKSNEGKKSPAPAFVEDLEFKIRVDYDSTAISKTVIENLFVITSTLGGWGKRSRRGFGSLVVTEINGTIYNSPTNLVEIQNCLDIIVPSQYTNSGMAIESKTVTSITNDSYPKLWKIEIGANPKTLSDIGQATHKIKGSSPSVYSISIGDGRPRYASPIYISILPNNLPVISTLKKQSAVDYSLQDNLKNEIII